MIVFPNCKINIGLNITNKREDGFHDLETIFYPVNLYDALEVLPAIAGAEVANLYEYGFSTTADPRQNIVYKAFELFRNATRMNSPVDIHLLKAIPSGAGLGGGSANGAFALKLFNDFFETRLSKETLLELALKLGSDCPFFMLNRPVFAQGRGEQFTELDFTLPGFKVLLINPGIHISTAAAFGGIKPAKPAVSLTEAIKMPVEQWKSLIVNDFEKTVFDLYPEIMEIKGLMYKMGAVYASLTGTGSTVYGLFNEWPKNMENVPGHYRVYKA